MRTMEVQSILSEKGVKLLVLDNFKFSKAHTAKCGKIRWRCTNVKSRCNAKIYTGADEKIILESQLDHNHEQEKKIARQAISNSVKRKAIEDCTERPSKLIHKELTNNDWASDLGSDDLERVRRNLVEARRILPPLPQDRDQVFDAVVSLNLKTKIKNEDFLCCLDKENSIIAFSCSTNLHFLCSCDTIYMDRTFEYCTKFFEQLLIIHASKNGYYVPIVFALLPDNSSDTYFKFFQNISDECRALKLCFNPKKVIVDACGEFNSLLKKSFYSPHSNIFSFVDIILNIQNETFAKIKIADKLTGLKKVKSVVRRKREYTTSKKDS